MAEKNQTTKEGHQKKTGLAGKKRWIEKRLKRSTIDVVVTQNEEETSEDSTASSEQHTDLCTSPTWSSEPWNTSVDQSPNQLKPLAVKGSNYNSLRETERQQMKQIKTQHMETLNERHITEEVGYINVQKCKSVPHAKGVKELLCYAFLYFHLLYIICALPFYEVHLLGSHTHNIYLKVETFLNVLIFDENYGQSCHQTLVNFYNQVD